MKESNFLILFVGYALLRLFKILAGRVHIEFKEALIKSARAGSERFCSQARFGKWRIHGINLIKVL